MDGQLNQTPEPRTEARRGRRSRRVLIVAGVLAFALAAGGAAVVAAAQGSSDGTRGERSADVDELVTTLSSATPTFDPPRSPVPSEAPSPDPEPSPDPKPEPEPKPDPYALEDGVYPTFVREVDVSAGTVTVDVIQLFKHDEAVRAALQDGVARRNARYLTLYVRNENDLLRTIPVARDVKIHFMGVCEVPPNRHVALTQLEDATTPYDETFYYAITMEGGQIQRMGQHLAIVAC